MFVFKVRISVSGISEYRGSYFGLLDDILNVAYGNKTCFAEDDLVAGVAVLVL